MDKASFLSKVAKRTRELEFEFEGEVFKLKYTMPDLKKLFLIAEAEGDARTRELESIAINILKENIPDFKAEDWFEIDTAFKLALMNAFSEEMAKLAPKGKLVVKDETK